MDSLEDWSRESRWDCGFAASVELVTRAKTGSFASLEVLNGSSATEELFLQFRGELFRSSFELLPALLVPSSSLL